MHATINKLFQAIIFAVIIFTANLNVLATVTVEDIIFHKAFTNESYDDSGDEDNGGIAYVYIKNNDGTARSISQVLLNGTDLDTLAGNGTIEWWMNLPQTIEAGQMGAIYIKGYDAPIADGQNITVAVQSSSGTWDSDTTTLSHPKLRLGSVIPGRDFKSVYLFLRNLDNASYTINLVYMTDDVTSQCSYVGDNVITPAEEVGIIKVSFPSRIEPMTEFFIKIQAARAGGGTVWTGAPYRLVEPFVPIGSWASSLDEETEQAEQQYVREILFNCNTGSENYSRINAMYYKYYVKSFPLENSTSDLAMNRGNPAILAWFLSDEPDFSAQPVSGLIQEQYNCRQYDPTHPTYLNMAKNNRFGKYGHVTDIVGMDHYIMYAPNALGGSGGEFEELPAYMEALKDTCEPKLLWCWPQLAADTWGDHQPEPWGIDVQFWTHVMMGSKGFMWFDHGPGEQDDHPTQYAEGEQCAKKLNQIRSLVLYGETADIVNVGSSSLLSRAIVTEDAVVVIVCNYNIDSWLDLGHWHKHYDQDPVNGTNVQVTVPNWIPVQQVTEITDSQAVTPSYSVNGQTVTINFDINEDSKVYIIGKNDTTAPDAPIGVQCSYRNSPAELSLNWQDTFDNYGVWMYRVYKNGTLLGSTKAPIYTDSAAVVTDVYEVEAIDAAGNVSKRSRPVSMSRLDMTFVEEGDFQGMRFENSFINAEAREGALKMDLAGKCWVYSDELDFPASDYRYLRVRLKNGTSDTIARFGWITDVDPSWTVQKSNRINTEAYQAEFEEYIVDLPDKEPDWKDRIKQIRFVVAQNAITGHVEIDYIILQNTPPYVGGDSDGNSTVNYLDFMRFAEGWLKDYTDWQEGNYNGDDITDFEDLRNQAMNWLW